jgi:hypothetical protein
MLQECYQFQSEVNIPSVVGRDTRLGINNKIILSLFASLNDWCLLKLQLFLDVFH